jgi:hypothetical protein
MDTRVYQDFIDRHSDRIERLLKGSWPTTKSPRHWSGMNLSARCAELKTPFDQIYAEDYARVSWYVHPGLTGVLNVPAETFIHMCGFAYHLSVRSYRESLLTMIRVFKLSKGNEHIEARLEAALEFPFADTPEQVEALRKQAGLP